MKKAIVLTILLVVTLMSCKTFGPTQKKNFKYPTDPETWMEDSGSSEE